MGICTPAVYRARWQSIVFVCPRSAKETCGIRASRLAAARVSHDPCVRQPTNSQTKSAAVSKVDTMGEIKFFDKSSKASGMRHISPRRTCRTTCPNSDIRPNPSPPYPASRDGVISPQGSQPNTNILYSQNGIGNQRRYNHWCLGYSALFNFA